LAVLVAARFSNRYDWPPWDGMVAVGLLVTVLAGRGTARLLADPTVHWIWVAVGALISTAGVWAGVPETGPAVVVGGALAGLLMTAVLTRSSWAPAAAGGLAAVVGWAALSGATGRPWASVGGALCAGVAPWLAVRLVVPILPGRRGARPWLLGAHMVLVVLAARWIAVVPQAGWPRVAGLGAAGLALATATRLGHDVGV
jgi:hypothetical protein